jgi:hypothetical protein
MYVLLSRRKLIRIVPKLMKDVEQISDNQGDCFVNKEDIFNHIEYPLCKAMEILLERNIPTTFSTANCHNYSGLAFISIDYNKLSDKNRKVADIYCIKKVGSCLLEIHFTPNTEVTVVSNAMLALADKFYYQINRLVERMTVEDVIAVYCQDNKEIHNKTLEEKIVFLEEYTNCFYSKNEGKFYWSIEQYIKANYRQIEE